MTTKEIYNRLHEDMHYAYPLEEDNQIEYSMLSGFYLVDKDRKILRYILPAEAWALIEVSLSIKRQGGEL